VTAGFGGARDWPTSAAWADLDNDGDLDRYVSSGDTKSYRGGAARLAVGRTWTCPGIQVDDLKGMRSSPDEARLTDGLRAIEGAGPRRVSSYRTR
jgi:hypothetical protein